MPPSRPGRSRRRPCSVESAVFVADLPDHPLECLALLRLPVTERACAPIRTASATYAVRSASPRRRCLRPRGALAGGPAPGLAHGVLIGDGEVLDNDRVGVAVEVGPAIRGHVGQVRETLEVRHGRYLHPRTRQKPRSPTQPAAAATRADVWEGRSFNPSRMVDNPHHEHHGLTLGWDAFADRTGDQNERDPEQRGSEDVTRGRWDADRVAHEMLSAILHAVEEVPDDLGLCTGGGVG